MEEQDQRHSRRRHQRWKNRGVAAHIDPAKARKVVNVVGLYVTPGWSIFTCTSTQAPASAGLIRATTASIRTASRFAAA